MKVSMIALCGVVILMAATTAECQTAAKQGMACVLPKGRDVLLKLMQCCKRDLRNNEDCKEYDTVNRYVIIHDNAPTKAEAYLLIPTVKITGIDDRRIFKAPYLNLWVNAWDMSARYPGWNGRRIGLAINSAHARTQDQLHVHISCINADVARVLDEKTQGSGQYTAPLGPKGNLYTVTERNDLTDGESPFRIAQEIDRGMAMGDKSVAVVKSKDGKWYLILTSVYRDGKGGNAEELLDERCSNVTASKAD